MDLRAIRTEGDYDWALAEVERYFDREPEAGSRDAERFDILAALIAEYEARNWSIDVPDPISAIEDYMATRGLRQTDLARILGSRSRASEILGRKRALTLDMINRLQSEWHISAEILVRPYHLEQVPPASLSRG